MPADDTQLIKYAHEHGHSSSTVQTLLRAARGFGNKVGEIAKDTIVVINNNPKKTCLVVVCGVVFIAPMIAVCPLLGAAGFGAAGPIAGSLAASWQASIGTVAAGTIFATLQSAAMGGVGAAIVGGIVQLGMVSILGIVLRKKIVRSLVNAYRNVLLFVREQVHRVYMRGMRHVLQAQRGLPRNQGRRSIGQ